jgi:hypothetical protein
MTKKTRRPGSFLLSMIAKAKSDLPVDLAEVSDAELIQDMARCLGDFLREGAPHLVDEDDFKTLACLIALARARAGYHPSEGENAALAVAEKLLAEIDLEFDPDQLRTIWQSDAFEKFQAKFNQWTGVRDQTDEEIAVWCAELWACAGGGVGVLEKQLPTGP